MAKCDNQVLDTVMSTVNSAVETLSTVAQNFVEKNRTKAKLNRLRMVMKSESELMNRAYIALGKEYYQILKKGDAEPTEKQEKLLEVIDSCKAKIARARDCYRTIVESQNEYIYSTPAKSSDKEAVTSADVIDITVACSNESDYKTSPFSDAKEAVKEKAEDIKETVAEKKEDVAEKAENIKEAAVEITEDIKEAAVDTKKAAAENAKEAKKKVRKAVKKAVDEECPEDELF